MGIPGEPNKDKAVCTCGNDKFFVYVTVIIDDARLYCTECHNEWEG